MSQKVVLDQTEEILNNNKVFSDEIYVLEKLEPVNSYMSYIDIAGSDMPPSKVATACYGLMRKGILEHGLVKSDGWKGSLAAYRIKNENVRGMVSVYVAENPKSKKSE